MDFNRSHRNALDRRAICVLGIFGAALGVWENSSFMGAILGQKETSLSHLTLIAIEAALLAGDILKQGYGTHFAISSKEGRHNLVTEYDHKAEKAIIDFLKVQVPESQFLAEESGATGHKEQDIRWIIDPLDGTVNFAHQIPFFSVSIAAEKQGRVVAGVVYQPITQELFVAEKERGAFLNGKTLRVSSISKLEDSILSTGFPYNLIENPLHCIEHFTDILRLGIPIRRLGVASIDLSYMAAGRFDAFFEAKLAHWDYAAAGLLIEEAGGKLTNWSGHPVQPNHSILASNGHLHPALVSRLKSS
jgi:myo-inositol-1(or 4)-monophosphatase